MDVDFGLKVAIYSISSPQEVDGGDRRMVTDLLCVDGTAIDESLEGLSKNRVEGFFNIKIKDAVGKGKSNAVLESLNGVTGARLHFYEVRCERQGLAYTL